MGNTIQVPETPEDHEKSFDEINDNECLAMQSLIKVINKLQEVFSVIGKHEISLPQIVVVGTQSSGKSSVLESLVGRSFLPRGTGIVTRAPLVLQMIKYSEEDFKNMIEKTEIDNIKQWAIFSHRPDEIFYDFDKVREEIETRTDILAGSFKGITHKQIILKVYTNKFDLTFVDLPGLTKVPVGDQPEDIDEQIQELVHFYVNQENTIILAVVTANTDPSTSESLKIARKVDPEGHRTIAVVTKLDLIDKGTLQDTADLLCGQKIPVRLGIIGVINRSQEDINDKKSLKLAIKAEEEFLKKNYPEICQFNGNKALSNLLQRVLITQIKKTYPILKDKLELTKVHLEDELKLKKTPESNASFVYGLLKDMSKSYCDTVNGNRKNVSDKCIEGGAKIVNMINKEYLQKIIDIDPLQDLDKSKIANILLNSSGTKKCSIVNEKALKILVSRQLKFLTKPSLDCVYLVREEMSNIFDSIDERILEKIKRFPRLFNQVKIKLNNMLDETVNDVKYFVKSYVKTYQNCITTISPDFLSELIQSEKLLALASGAEFTEETEVFSDYEEDKNYVKQSVKYVNYGQLRIIMTDEEKKQVLLKILSGTNELNKNNEISNQVEFHRKLTKCYFKFVRKNVMDFVAKRIHYKMIDSILDNFEKYMIQNIFEPYMRENKFNEILQEEEEIIKSRIKAEMNLNAVKKALETMTEVQMI
ncbi:dynamin-1-like protein [Daktulosphaira vitifoliae]|uniref:dynamin-1-like protein n=1 Tax=Daktulosphaira vitifoliae TaxID=58002 RepID=UPI0021AB03D9|nr:dynamin-1-like protein [Daktulosphaira vitifoliae]XP_050541199.1 dynamin-1-like protein [Daktulosphaira vitifoliae]XP_050541200.1 dynamin-1-like protein [Daktulosphaira vitifoliae]